MMAELARPDGEGAAIGAAPGITWQPQPFVVQKRLFEAIDGPPSMEDRPWCWRSESRREFNSC
jgi:hypothetical protein